MRRSLDKTRRRGKLNLFELQHSEYQFRVRYASRAPENVCSSSKHVPDSLVLSLLAFLLRATGGHAGIWRRSRRPPTCCCRRAVARGVFLPLGSFPSAASALRLITKQIRTRHVNNDVSFVPLAGPGRRNVAEHRALCPPVQTRHLPPSPSARRSVLLGRHELSKGPRGAGGRIGARAQGRARAERCQCSRWPRLKRPSCLVLRPSPPLPRRRSWRASYTSAAGGAPQACTRACTPPEEPPRISRWPSQPAQPRCSARPPNPHPLPTLLLPKARIWPAGGTLLQRYVLKWGAPETLCLGGEGGA